mmetsp:Transcript_31227/g.48928  ORF Transcript_31227/g.48928 Transcript_31227/m.48928 type:complete len:114 (-) Transcript_31227:345-686(-)
MALPFNLDKDSSEWEGAGYGVVAGVGIVALLLFCCCSYLCWRRFCKKRKTAPIETQVQSLREQHDRDLKSARKEHKEEEGGKKSEKSGKKEKKDKHLKHADGDPRYKVGDDEE